MRAWAEDWDDDEVDDAFAKQLRAELVRSFIWFEADVLFGSHAFFRRNLGMWLLLQSEFLCSIEKNPMAVFLSSRPAYFLS